MNNCDFEKIKSANHSEVERGCHSDTIATRIVQRSVFLDYSEDERLAGSLGAVSESVHRELLGDALGRVESDPSARSCNSLGRQMQNCRNNYRRIQKISLIWIDCLSRNSMNFASDFSAIRKYSKTRK